MKTRFLPLVLALPLAACGAEDDGTASSSSASTATGTGSSDGGATSASTSGSSTGGSGGAAPGTATLRIHYPAGSAITVRGSGAGLDWTAGKPTDTSEKDVFTYQVTGITSVIEWKPLLNDTDWSRGPNYHLAPGQTEDVYPHFKTTGLTGQVVTLIDTFHSTALNDDRAIYAYLPAGYDENTAATYPVVYMHDGQNLWAAHPELAFGATWNVDTAFDDAAELGACSSATVAGWGAQPLGDDPTTCTGDGDCNGGTCVTFPEAIVIGVANDDNRIYEYTPTTDPDYPAGGGADLYLKMLVTELKPKVDGMLRTRPEVASTALVGSSLGGLVSAYGGLKYPDVYGMIGEISPSTWWNNLVIVGDVKSTAAAPKRPLIVYVDSGEGDADDQADTDQLAAAYLALGYQDGQTFRHVVQAGASHNEVYWAERFPGAMQLLLGAR